MHIIAFGRLISETASAEVVTCGYIMSQAIKSFSCREAHSQTAKGWLSMTSSNGFDSFQSLSIGHIAPLHETKRKPNVWNTDAKRINGLLKDLG